MNVNPAFRSPPIFEFGQNVILRYEESRKGRKVAQCILYGVIIGIRFCPEESDYVGWVYDLQAYKLTIDDEIRYPDDDMPPSLTAECKEINLETCSEQIDLQKIIDSIYFRKKLIEESLNR
jgi:hypothetical protein